MSTEDSYNPFERNFSSGLSDTFKFFESVNTGELSKLDIHNKIQELTDNYDEDKVTLICEEFDEYIFVKYENWIAKFSKEIIDKWIDIYQKNDIKLPIKGDENKNEVLRYYLPYVKQFFLRTRFGKSFSDDEYEKQMDELFGPNPNKGDVIDENVLMGGFYQVTQSRSLKNLRDILVNLKRKYTDAVYRFEDTKDISNNIQPINWLKGEESLRQFLESLKRAGFIENRETEQIIQDHFKQSDKEPQALKWSKTNRLIIYLFIKLSESGLIDTMNRQFQLITEHFLDKKGKPFKRDSLKTDALEVRYVKPRGAKTIDRIIQDLTV